MRRIFFAAVLSVVLLLADSAARLYLILIAPTHPVPAELAYEYSKLSVRLTANGYWVINEYHGRLYDYAADGSRRVIGTPRHYDYTVYLFGNSGLQDPYSRDQTSMTSVLQSLYNRAGYHVRIVNRGAPGQRISGEYAWLLDTPLQSSDTVIFMDGSVGYTPNCTMGSSLALIELACALDNQYLPPRYADVDDERYQQAAHLASIYTRSKGAWFYHFAQPSIEPLPLAKKLHRIKVPISGFADEPHMNPTGDAIAARDIFDALTLI